MLYLQLFEGFKRKTRIHSGWASTTGSSPKALHLTIPLTPTMCGAPPCRDHRWSHDGRAAFVPFTAEGFFIVASGGSPCRVRQKMKSPPQPVIPTNSMSSKPLLALRERRRRHGHSPRRCRRRSHRLLPAAPSYADHQPRPIRRNHVLCQQNTMRNHVAQAVGNKSDWPLLSSACCLLCFCSHPIGRIRSTETALDSKVPTVASFSSRGPNLISPGILKVVNIQANKKKTTLMPCICDVLCLHSLELMCSPTCRRRGSTPWQHERRCRRCSGTSKTTGLRRTSSPSTVPPRLVMSALVTTGN
jgi:hypothetical protein